MFYFYEIFLFASFIAKDEIVSLRDNRTRVCLTNNLISRADAGVTFSWKGIKSEFYGPPYAWCNFKKRIHCQIIRERVTHTYHTFDRAMHTIPFKEASNTEKKKRSDKNTFYVIFIYLLWYFVVHVEDSTVAYWQKANFTPCLLATPSCICFLFLHSPIPFPKKKLKDNLIFHILPLYPRYVTLQFILSFHQKCFIYISSIIFV